MTFGIIIITISQERRIKIIIDKIQDKFGESGEFLHPYTEIEKGLKKIGLYDTFKKQDNS